MEENRAKATECCHREKERLMDELYRCDYCSTSLEEHDACRMEAAVESGRRAKGCISD
jgi:hypothetical protein